jgi:hypothetical protein
MSTEGKKKRGESGLKNVQSIPFRYGGKPCNLSPRIGNTNHHGGSTLVRGMVGGLLARSSIPSGDFDFEISQRLVRLTNEAMARCTHPNLT